LNNKLNRNISFFVIHDSKIWTNKVKKVEKIINSILNYKKYFINNKCKNYNITFLLTNDNVLKKLNTVYRNKKKPTNVLTFTNSYEHKKNIMIKNIDIAISGNKILLEANRLKVNFYDHLSHIIIHALLHSNGYMHDNSKNFQKMKKKEEFILKRLNIANPYKY